MDKLLALTGQVRRQAGKVLGDLKAHRLKIKAQNFIAVLQAQAQLRHYLPLVDQVMAQTAQPSPRAMGRRVVVLCFWTPNR